MTPPETIVTRAALRSDLAALGVQPGDTLLVHTSLKKLGLVIGGVRTVVESLFDAVGESGTIMMPAYSGDLSDPAEWQFPPVPAESVDAIREAMPAYDPQLSPTRNLGVVPEYFRRFPGVLRSPHPQSSFAARGALAERLVGRHGLAFRFGPDSPLGALVTVGGKVLMLAAPWDTISFFYHSYYPRDGRQILRKRSPMIIDGKKDWVPYDDIPHTSAWFFQAADFLVAEGIARVGPTGAARSLIFSAAEALPVLRDLRRRYSAA